MIGRIKEVVRRIKQVKEDNEQTRLLIGSLLAKNIGTAKSFKEAEFKVFSQFGDDGIVQFLINNVTISTNKFVEFGVENYEESNTRFLLMHNNWSGLVIDGSQDNVSTIKNSPLFWRYDLTAVQSFITVENINQILGNNGFDGEIGVLSIDIDGNDYWVWKAITVSNPTIVIVEYNSLFGAERSITIPYKPDFFRGDAHYSYLYLGASLPAFCDLAYSKGYAFVGCNQAGNNAYFVKEAQLGALRPLTPTEGFIKARFRESRDNKGNLSFANFDEQYKLIRGMPVFNVRTQQLESL